MHKTFKFALTEAYEKGFDDGVKASTITDVNWEEQNKMRDQWILDNPNADYLGWMSI